METIKKALITGGNGNLGRLLARELTAKGIDVICFDLPETDTKDEIYFNRIFLGDIRDQDIINGIYRKNKYIIINVK